jgi:acid phosphatase type 7
VLLALVVGLVMAVFAPAASASFVVAAVGDLGCSPTDPDYGGGYGIAGGTPTTDLCRQRYVAGLLPTIAAGNPPRAFLPLGDTQYYSTVDTSEESNFQAVYGATFGQVNSVAFPIIGNAEYGLDGSPRPADTSAAAGWFAYFGADTGVLSSIPSRSSHADVSQLANGYYSYDINTWHFIALNSNCEEYAVCNAAAEEAWLASDLAAHPDQCTVAYFHHPRWNSGSLGNDPLVSGIWTQLYNAGVDIVLNGHGNHHYERFVAQNANGAADPVKGVTEFIVATGGDSHGTPGPTIDATSAVRNYDTFGVLSLTLDTTSYSWQFLSEPGMQTLPGVSPTTSGFPDSGGPVSCHSATATTASYPTLLTAAAGNAIVHLSWSQPAHDGGAPITGYRIYRGTSPGGETLLATTAGASPLSYDDATVTNGTTYYYRVAAVTYVGTGAQAAETSALPVLSGTLKNLGLPLISGDTATGQTLTVSPGSWSGTPPITLAYQWQRCAPNGASCTHIATAAATSYPLGLADIGHTIRVVVTAANPVTATLAVTTAASSVIRLGVPTAITPPAITGRAQKHARITCRPGAWTSSPTTFTFTWLRDGNAIASGAAYTVQAADVGLPVSCQVGATNAAGTGTATSASVSPLVGSAITLTSTPRALRALVGVAVRWPKPLAVFGVVTDNNGRPAAAARVRLELETSSGALISLLKTVTTNHAGRYAALVLPGRDGLLVAAVGSSSGVTAVAAAPIRVVVSPAITRLRAVRTRRQRIVVTGRILITTPNLVVTVVVTANGVTVATGRTDTKGRFTLPLPAIAARASRIVVHANPRHRGALTAASRSVRVTSP